MLYFAISSCKSSTFSKKKYPKKYTVNERDLFDKFLDFWEQHHPDIITGWNTEFFDIPYLCNRIKNLFGEDELKRLSPWKSVRDREVYQMGRKHQVYEIVGIAGLDYFDLYR